MNKKVNTLLFVLCATLFNVLVAILTCILLILLYTFLLSQIVPDAVNDWILPIIFMLGIVTSFLSYRALFKFLVKKIDVEKYFDPIFTRGRK